MTHRSSLKSLTNTDVVGSNVELIFPLPLVAMFLILPIGGVFSVVGAIDILADFSIGFMRRQNEHKADHVACMLGFGNGLKKYIESCDTESTLLKSYLRWHPRQSKRIKLMEG